MRWIRRGGRPGRGAARRGRRHGSAAAPAPGGWSSRPPAEARGAAARGRHARPGRAALPEAEARHSPIWNRDRIGAAVDIEQHHRHPFRREDMIATSSRRPRRDRRRRTRMDQCPAVARALFQRQRHLLVGRWPRRKTSSQALTERSCVALWRCSSSADSAFAPLQGHAALSSAFRVLATKFAHVRCRWRAKWRSGDRWQGRRISRAQRILRVPVATIAPSCPPFDRSAAIAAPSRERTVAAMCAARSNASALVRSLLRPVEEPGDTLIARASPRRCSRRVASEIVACAV